METAVELAKEEVVQSGHPPVKVGALAAAKRKILWYFSRTEQKGP